jgi:predicted component of type VI protein secretion system
MAAPSIHSFREHEAAPDMASLAKRILEKLEPRVVRVAVDVSMTSPGMNVAIERRVDGRRHAVFVRASPTWEREAIDALLEWLETKGA